MVNFAPIVVQAPMPRPGSAEPMYVVTLGGPPLLNWDCECGTRNGPTFSTLDYCFVPRLLCHGCLCLHPLLDAALVHSNGGIQGVHYLMPVKQLWGRIEPSYVHLGEVRALQGADAQQSYAEATAFASSMGRAITRPFCDGPRPLAGETIARLWDVQGIGAAPAGRCSMLVSRTEPKHPLPLWNVFKAREPWTCTTFRYDHAFESTAPEADLKQHFYSFPKDIQRVFARDNQRWIALCGAQIPALPVLRFDDIDGAGGRLLLEYLLHFYGWDHIFHPVEGGCAAPVYGDSSHDRLLTIYPRTYGTDNVTRPLAGLMFAAAKDQFITQLACILQGPQYAATLQPLSESLLDIRGKLQDPAKYLVQSQILGYRPADVGQKIKMSDLHAHLDQKDPNVLTAVASFGNDVEATACHADRCLRLVHKQKIPAVALHWEPRKFRELYCPFCIKIPVKSGQMLVFEVQSDFCVHSISQTFAEDAATATTNQPLRDFMPRDMRFGFQARARMLR